MSQPRYVTARYLAAQTGMSARYFRNLAAQGKLPGAVQPSGPGGAWRFDLQQFNRWWKSKEVKGVKWPASTGAEKSGGDGYSATVFCTGEAYEQRLERLRKSVLDAG